MLAAAVYLRIPLLLAFAVSMTKYYGLRASRLLQLYAVGSSLNLCSRVRLAAARRAIDKTDADDNHNSGERDFLGVHPLVPIVLQLHLARIEGVQ